MTGIYDLYYVYTEREMSISLPSSCADPPSPAPHNFIFMYTSRARVVSTTILSFFSPSRARVSRARTGNSLTESSREQRGALCACLAAVQLCTERGHQRSTRGSLALFLCASFARSLARIQCGSLPSTLAARQGRSRGASLLLRTTLARRRERC